MEGGLPCRPSVTGTATSRAVGGSHPPARPGVAFPYTGRIPCRPFPLRHHGGRGEGGNTAAGVSRRPIRQPTGGNKVGKPFKSSVFGKEAGVAALERRMHNAAAWEKTHRKSPPPPPERLPPPCRPQGMTGRSSSGNSCGRVSAWYSVRMKPGASMGDLHRPCRQSRLQRLPSGQGVLRRRVQRPFRRAGRHSPAATSAGVEHPTRQQEHTGASQWDGHTGYRPDHKDGTTQNVAAAFNLFAPYPAGASGDQPVPPQRKKKKSASTAGNNNQLLKFNELCKTKTICVDS